MVQKKRRGRFFWVPGIILFLFAAPVVAAEFPTKPVTVIVPWPPGGATDIVLRVLAELTTKHLGQPIVTENKPGGGGTVGGAMMAATAKPDGYTVAQLPITTFRYPYMMKVDWDPLKDFTYVIHLTGYTYGVVVKADSPWKTWQEFIAYAKANPGKITYASPGAGSTLYFLMEMVALKEGIKWIHVPMKGGAESMTAVLGGHVSAMADGATWAPHVDSGAVRLLTTWGNRRTKKWPQVPTLKEMHGLVATGPWGLAGPRGIDPKVVKILHDAFKKGMEEPAFQNALDKYDMEASYMNSDDYTKYVKQLCEEEKTMVEKVGFKKK